MSSVLNARLLDELNLPGAPAADALHIRALEHAELADVDLLTLRDLLVLSGYDELALQALLLAMFQELGQGSLCLRLSAKSLQQKFRELTGEDQPKLVAEALAGIRTGRWPALISEDEDAYVPLIRRLLGAAEFLYFQKTWSHARVLRRCLEQRLANADVPGVRPAALRPVLESVFRSQAESGCALNREQQLGVCLALVRRFAIVSGGPGTGKTAIVFALLKCLLAMGIRVDEICIAAPTGRAAHRMTESIRERLNAEVRPDDALKHIHGQTLHRLLAFNPQTGKFVHDEFAPLPIRMLVVDEVSMVDVNLMARLLRAVPPDAHVLLLGDKDQLPSVEAGAVLADLIPGQFEESFSQAMLNLIHGAAPDLQLPGPDAEPHPLTDSIVVLKTSYRSEKHILDLADAVNRQQAGAVEMFHEITEGKAAVLPGADAGGAFFRSMPGDDRQALQALLDNWATEIFLKPSADEPSYMELLRSARQIDFSALEELSDGSRQILDGLFAVLRRGQILTFVRRGQVGVNGINQYLDRELRRVFEPQAYGPVFVGAPIMIQRNERTRNLFNGDVGIVLRGRDGNLRAVFRRLGSYVEYGVESLPPFELAFAVTVHKSQGSEYERVLLFLPDTAAHRLLSKEIVYTGLTRARRWVLMVGRKQVFAAAVARRIERETGISVWGEHLAITPVDYPVDRETGQLELFEC